MPSSRKSSFEPKAPPRWSARIRTPDTGGQHTPRGRITIVVADTRDELLRQLCADLRLMWHQAGGPSVRTLSGRIGLGKSQLGAILNGDVRTLPDWDVAITPQELGPGSCIAMPARPVDV